MMSLLSYWPFDEVPDLVYDILEKCSKMSNHVKEQQRSSDYVYKKAFFLF